MKKMFFLMLTLCILGAAGANAQVNIGSPDNPKEGALLDLSQSGAKLGLILPNVKLDNLSTWQLEGTGADAAGTVVFNTNAGLTVNGKTLGQGIFVWNGNGWQAAKGGTGEVLAQDFTLMSGSDTFTDGNSFDLWTGSSKSFTVDESSFQPTSTDVAKGVRWSIAPADIATIKTASITACEVEGVAAGTAILTVTSLDNNVTKKITIHVLPVTLASFELDKTELNLTASGSAGTVTASNFKGSDGLDFTGAVSVDWALASGDLNGSTEDKQDETYTVTPGTSAATWTVVASAGGITMPAFTVNVTCPASGATLSSATGTDAQAVQKGATITDITYSLTNVAAIDGVTVTWNVNPGLTVNLNGSVLTISGNVPNDVTVETIYTYSIKTTNVCGEEEDGPTGSIKVIVWPDALLVINAARDYSESIPGDQAKNWTSASNSVQSGSALYASYQYETDGVAPSTGKDLMVSKFVYSSDNKVESTTAGSSIYIAAANLGGLSSGISWADAVMTCANLEESGYEDWYLPNSMELEALWKAALLGNNPPIDEYIDYWSSTEGSAANAWQREFHQQGSGLRNHDKVGYTAGIGLWSVVRCVRRTN